LPALSPEALRQRIRAQLDAVSSWDHFMHTRVVLEPDSLIDPETRNRLEQLPDMVRIRGDAVPLEYEIENGTGVARVRLREGQAKRLREGELPDLDRPLRFAVQRGRHPPVLAESIATLHSLLRRLPKTDRLDDDRGEPLHRRARRRTRRQGRRR
jgi:hypothetical protein